MLCVFKIIFIVSDYNMLSNKCVGFMVDMSYNLLSRMKIWQFVCMKLKLSFKF